MNQKGSAVVPSETLQPGDRLGNYILREVVGEGAFATVWKAAHHERPGRVVALKIATDPAFRKQLSREGRLPDIQHPNVVPILDCDTRFADHPYVVMPFYAAGSLADLIAYLPHGLPEDRVEALLKDILSGLSAAHQQGVVHRDIKPANILLDEEGRALVADFGLSLREFAPDGVQSLVQSASRSIEPNGALAGTLAYMAPEVVSGAAATKASDVYSVGLLLFEMLTGRRPAGLELPSQVRTDLRRSPYWDALFYCACRPVAERYPDAEAMACAAEEAPEDIPWAHQRTEAIASGMATDKAANESLKPRSSEPCHRGHLKQQGRFHRPLISMLVVIGVLYILTVVSISKLWPAFSDWLTSQSFLLWFVILGPLVIIAVFALQQKHQWPKFAWVAVLMWLAIITFGADWSSSPMYKWWKEQKVMARAATPTATAGTREMSSRVKSETVIAEPGEWSDFIQIPPWQDFWWETAGCVKVKNSLGKIYEGESCPDKYLPIGKNLSPAETKLSFLPLERKEKIKVSWKPQ